ncbi:DUF3047 domain-containing protein [Mesorhizobium sp.]|uniref:DUF3047 domain-containing protein n=1 Tax=Mesorhizobium sp. TaxID=1871066 RepID=UPI000FEA83A6|nr:DUF3047 domain-containing protein [Mesorhizobium sp.]RWM19451.1 MAG: DUF3047 domain-containing protein [Mesorhizobium sp.]RWM31218.1 MAG: DUF3047 domain-containing protein [Mesorhizobium sp.]TIO72975.1 MAG: DUF3047 domain-containing protein [Mesorhizobium sp.]TIO80979.1 MAG: DUF3047 domain-containing protein [Mesorhizobium sp.]TJV47966.1 MAG: DUF3047 domain-containing protein [Mesorhizobium sp.]
MFIVKLETGKLGQMWSAPHACRLGIGIAAKTVMLAILLVPTFGWAQSADDIAIGTFSRGSLSNWQSRSFKGETAYEIVRDLDLGATVLAATANGAASGRYRRIRIDLVKTPFLNWSWKVMNVFAGIDETVKSGDDFPARIYVAVERGLLGARSLALNYVWASQHALGSDWPSPYTSQVRLIASDSGSQGIGAWVQHKRNLREDLKKAFNEDITEIDAVAVMTDTDDHKGHAQTFYGDIWFSSK